MPDDTHASVKTNTGNQMFPIKLPLSSWTPDQQVSHEYNAINFTVCDQK